MAHFQNNSVRPPYQGYPSSDLYAQQHAESSTSSLRRNRETLTRLQPLSDLPELYFDYEQPSPPSATATNLVSTPPPQEGWSTTAAAVAPWQEGASPDVHSAPYGSFISPESNWAASLLPLGQAPPGASAPLGPSLAWTYHTQTSPEKAAVAPVDIHPPASYDDYDQPMSGGALDMPIYSGASACAAQVGIPPHFSASRTTHSVNNSAFGPSSLSSATSASILSDGPAPPAQFSPKSSSGITHMSTTISTSYPSPLLTAAPHQEPLKIHQPRPSRRIPIISLSHLASACDTYPIYPPQEPMGGISAEVKPAVTTLGRSRRQDSKPYLPITSHRASAQYKSSRQHSHSSHGIRHAPFSVGTNTGPRQAAQCPCGCMQSYICH